jgi:cell division protein FtsI/penicillin-binding protein 2
MSRQQTIRQRIAPRWAAEAAFGVLVLCVLGLGAYQARMIRMGNPEQLQRARRQQKMVVPLPARPGSIFARSGRSYVLAAGSRQVPRVFVDPFLLEDEQTAPTAIALGRILKVDPIAIQDIIIQRRERRYVQLHKALRIPGELTDQQIREIQELDHRAVGLTHEWRREYPNGPLAAEVMGFRCLDGRPGAGLELTANEHLAAAAGKQVMLTDAGRRPIWPVPTESIAPVDGSNVYLCLDAVIQEHTQTAVCRAVREYGAKWGVGVVMDVHTGEVLAMATSPSYDPNRFYEVDDPERLLNHAICSPYEPGSVMKPLYSAAAVEAGVATYETTIDAGNGVYHAPRGGRISDHGHSYGVITLRKAVVISSNIAMAKVGEMLGNRALHNTAKRYGFARRTGINLPGESPGILRPLNKWDGYSLRRVPFGQEIAVTSLQLATAYCSIANGGLLLKPRLVDRVVDANGKTVYRSEREVVRRTLRPAVARQTVDVMHEVVEQGTGKRARLKHWTSFGKTGTAQIAGPGGYVDNAYVASFVGGAPATRPEVLCLVSVYWPDAGKGYYGGLVAAPAVKKILEETLSYRNVPSDKPRR